MIIPGGQRRGVTTGSPRERVNMAARSLTAAQRPHLGVLGVDLRDVGQPAAQHVRRDVVTELVLPFASFHSSPVDLGPAVGWRHRDRLRQDQERTRSEGVLDLNTDRCDPS